MRHRHKVASLLWALGALISVMSIPSAGVPRSGASSEPRAAVSPTAHGFGELPAVGRLFGTQGRQELSCMASSLSSPNKNLIITTADCVFDFRSGRTFDNMIFVPGYDAGKAPYGQYVLKSVYVHHRFLRNPRKATYNYAFVTVYDGIDADAAGRPKDVGRLGDNVGGLGFTWDRRLAEPVSGFGYAESPQGQPYLLPGGRLQACHGQSFPAVEVAVGIKCDLSRQAIGGPVLVRYTPGTGRGYVTGVMGSIVDITEDHRVDAMLYPYFDDEAHDLYLSATKEWSGRPSLSTFPETFDD
ncbi:peptidase [Sphaerisporangium krabiense]|uniref:Peptidase S1 domain-containing protein n=1 Tax=Sphaerisporangium krabiense TaxID=763782 RepID=A0A7W8Z8H9_9ACTN|nr:hypothetical protein [Sphaerisporangium krabiense]MBB5629444.1 hypothetical protein [Sphaerisporangium krabiense]GII65706.1 peptidase [Sphaerisporangium krabiense]